VVAFAEEVVESEKLIDVRPVLWNTRSYQIISWWDMKPFPVAQFLGYTRALQGMLAKPDEFPDALIDGTRKAEELDILKNLSEEAESYALFSTADQFIRMYRLIENGTTPAKFNELIPEVLNRLEDDCKRHVVMVIEPEYVKYAADNFDPTGTSAKKVSVQFSSAADDIAEAGKCLSFGRSTACVMHLNRVVEVGLTALAGALNVPPQNDWGKYLKKIDEELADRLKTSGARSGDEQFYAEVAITIDSIRRAWRNPTMHVAKTHTLEQAEEIYVAVRSFMRHLATKLHD
jgi:hypothetical protein